MQYFNESERGETKIQAVNHPSCPHRHMIQMM